MNFSFPECRNILVLAPHPDDEALGCSGTILLLSRKGASVTTVFISDGEKLNEEPSSVIAAKRREEGIRAAVIMGCEVPLFLGFPDGELRNHYNAVRDRLSEVIREKKPDIILAPSPIDYHNDHIALSFIVLDLLERVDLFKVAFYEVYSTIRFSHLIDITEVAEQKKRIISTYRVSLYEKPEIYASAALGLNAQRAIFAQKHGYYEAFYIVGKNDDIAGIHDFLSYRDSIK